MSFNWRLNTTFTPELAQQFVESQGWNLHIDTITYFGQGSDNVAFLVNDRLVFRFAKTDETAAWLRQENVVLPHLQTLSLPVPNPMYIGTPNNNNPYYFHGYAKLAGTPAYQVNLSDDDLKVCLQQLAGFLKELHGFKHEAAQALGAIPAVYDRTNVSLVIEVLQQRLQKLHEQQVIQIDSNFIQQQIQQARTISLSHDKDCLVHGDLDMRHLLVVDQKLSGVIDWGDVGIGHPVTDLAAIFCWYPVEMHHLFFEIYGFVSEDVQKHARFLALNRAITLMWYGHGIDDRKMFDAAFQAYERLKTYRS